jgi:hypothetical protein
MDSFEMYHENPHWKAMYDYAMNEQVNGGYFSKGPNASANPMNNVSFPSSDEFSHTSLKRAQDTQSSYVGGLKNFAPGFITPKLRSQHKRCIENTVNPDACHEAAINKVRELVIMEENRNPGFSSRRLGLRFPSDLNSSQYEKY